MSCFVFLSHYYYYILQCLESQLKRLNILDQPDHLFNCDESGINSHVATREKAYGVKGEQTFQQKVHEIKLQNTTTGVMVAGWG